MFIINIVYTIFLGQLVKQCFVELLSWITNFFFFPALFIPYEPISYYSNNLFENIARGYVSVNMLLMKCTLTDVCVYFLYCDTLKNISSP